MREPVLVPPAGGEVIGDVPDRRVEILSDDERLNATWSRFAPRREGADLHVHRHHTDCFYVLAGELTVRLGLEDERVTVSAGTLARVPPLVVHGFLNGSDAELRYLNFHAPGQRFADYLRATRDGRSFTYDQHEPPEDGGRPASEAVVGGAVAVIDRPGLRVELLADVEEIGISETRCRPGALPALPHRQGRHVESLYVLEGELALTVGERELRVTTGTWAQVLPGVTHTIGPAGAGDVRFLELRTPSCDYGAFLRELHDARMDEEVACDHEHERGIG
jgi:mannose-6-phosphate isomerase-like protein (cupin superfamily)